ncbi:MAG: hypothetical protein U5N55_14160 [Cypionkella sp.]|nr:hypothetical protein [Cypionkella sp.]
MNNFGYETGVSTLGIYIGPSYKVNDKFVARLPIYFGSVDLADQVDLDDFKGSFDTASVGIMADYHPFRGGFASGFRVSGGIAAGGYNLKGDITDPEIDGTVYTGKTEMEFKQSSAVVPVISVAYAKTFKNGIGILAEVGAKIGTYSVTASSDFLTGANKANFEADLKSANDELKELPAIPYITLGLSYRF